MRLVLPRLFSRLFSRLFPRRPLRQLAPIICAVTLAFLGTEAAARCAGVDLRAEIRASDPAAWAEAEAAAAAHPNSRGLLWEITADGTPPSYLFGTLHTPEAADLPIADRARALAARTRVLLVEITEADRLDMQAAMQSDPTLLLNPNPAPVSTWLEPELVAVLGERLAPYGIPVAAAGGLNPWFLNLLLSTPPCLAAAVGEEPVLDQVLMQEAAANGATVTPLETWREQLSALSDVTEADARDGLRYSLASPYAADDLLATLVAYYAEEWVMMTWEINLLLARRTLPAAEVERLGALSWDMLLVQRNIKMADAALAELQKGNAMIAVGALHLGGEEGLVALLEKRGFTLRRME